MQKTLAEIANIVGGEVIGNKNLIITGLNSLQEAREGDLTFIANPKYFSFAEKTKAAAIIVPLEVKIYGKSIIRIENPSLAFGNLASFITEKTAYKLKGIHEKAVIAEDAVIGKNVAIGPYAIIGAKSCIGDNTLIYGGCYIGYNTIIGKDCIIYPNVTIRERAFMGARIIIHSGTVIGSDGFGFIQIDGIHKKIPQTGTVTIEDDVEIGANVTIDRARFDKTVIGKGTKIDNLVQIAHNVRIGKNCIIIAQAGISGSVVIEDDVILAGQVGVTGHITIGKGSVVFGKSAVMKSIPPFTKILGNPARPHMEAKKVNACVQRLPVYVKAIQNLKKRIEALEKKTGTKNII